MTDQRRDLLKIRVELIGISPPVWREVLVPARYSFWDLHVAIQTLWVGWITISTSFGSGGASRDDALLVGIPSDEMWDDSLEVQPGWDIPVIDFLSEPGDRAQYEYDFGDGWIHEITLLGVEPRENGQRYPKCVADLMRQWIPKGWGPDLFKTEKVCFDNPLKRWKRPSN
jgi:hypothetical protein